MTITTELRKKVAETVLQEAEKHPAGRKRRPILSNLLMHN